MLLKIFLPAWVCICFFAIDSNYSDPVSGFGQVVEDYRCTPCGSSCDDEIYTAPGNCSHCQMPLVKKSSVHFNNIAPGDICAYIKKHPGVILLDVRTKEEFEGRLNQTLVPSKMPSICRFRNCRPNFQPWQHTKKKTSSSFVPTVIEVRRLATCSRKTVLTG
ncbi:MAG: hypothetical protein Q7T76_18405 [Ferruginibacter sp.]|nr:hypothetical protein [Ferruginibacter sp.]